MEQPPRPTAPTFLEAFRYWLKLGFISFGGPAGQIAMMHQELVEKRRWISERRFLHALNYCMLLPGPEAQQLAIYIGWLLHRTWGGIVAGTLFVLPSLFILAALTWVYLAFGDVTFVQGVFNGIKPAVVAIVLHAAWRIGARALKNNVLLAMAAASFLAIFALDVPFPYIVLGAGLLGALGGRFMPDKFRVGGGHGSSDKDHGPALIDDDTPRLAHTLFRPGRLVALILLFVALWGAALALLPHPVLRDMGEFFTKAALVTFGGAYAVLPYVAQQAVETHRWLSASEMIDGLGLAETTPGPLIMVLQFVGFMAGWYHARDLGLAGAVLGGLVATYFTFMPCFLWIFLGAPYVEQTRRHRGLAGAMAAITAAVVGVVLNLAVWFALHVLVVAPAGVNLFALGVAVAVFVALQRLRWDIVPVVLAAAGAGLARRLLEGGL